MNSFSLKAISLVLFGLFLINSIGCKKVPFDSRNKYVGEWDFITRWSNFNSLDSTSSSSTYLYVGEVWYEEKGKIKIQISESQIYDFDLSEEGELSNLGNYPDGSFSDDNNLEFSFHSGGMGGGSSVRVTGVKR